jgi:hypothetical protein
MKIVVELYYEHENGRRPDQSPMQNDRENKDAKIGCGIRKRLLVESTTQISKYI